MRHLPQALPRTCIVVICSFDYLLYALVCARQARKHAPFEVDVRLFLDADEDKKEIVRRASDATGIPITLVPASILRDLADAPDHSRLFTRSHLNRSALIRLKIAELVGDGYQRLLYLDSDIQVRRDLSDLFSIPLPPGKFLAVRDWKAHQTHENMPDTAHERETLSALGLNEAQWSRYFNSGVMLADIDTWRQIGSEALSFYRIHPEVCHMLDQCALNAVALDRIVPISPRWNFLRVYMDLPAFKDIDPAIIHFAAPPKPWNGNLPPWGPDGYAPYVELYNELKTLKLPWQRYPLWRQVKWRLKSVLKPVIQGEAYKERLDTLLRQDGL